MKRTAFSVVSLYIYTTRGTRFLLFDNTVVIGNPTCSVSAALSGALCLNYAYFCYNHLHIFAAATSHFPMRGEHTYLTDAWKSCISRVTGVKQFINLVHAQTVYIYSLHILIFNLSFALVFFIFVFTIFYSSSNAPFLCQLKKSTAGIIFEERKRIS